MSPSNPVVAATHPDPYPFYADLVARRPFYRDDTLGLWVASSARAVGAVLSSPACRVRPLPEPVPRVLQGLASAEVFGRLARMNEGPFHLVVRRALMTVLGTLGAEHGAEEGRRQARRLIAEEVPLRELVFRLPVQAVGALLGLEPGGLPEVASWTGALVRGMAPGADAEQVREGALAAERLMAVFHARLAHSEDGPLTLLSRELGASSTAPGALSREQADAESSAVIVSNAIGLLVQTHDATAGLLGNALRASLADPAVYAQVSSRPEWLPRLLDEVLRFDPPVQNTRRFLSEDAVIDGRALRAGDTVLVVLAAANRDPAVHHAPHRFDLHREPSELATFGEGRHACPGAALARAVSLGALEVLFATDLVSHRAAFSATGFQPSVNGRVPLLPRLHLHSREHTT
ncbi:cytochrome P450 family protein [Myxococcus stipitatus DSM 14675]|uniref:Cytochrome P450 family protein n=1 Tax=Myxococcus stipitatus (strain DSM 14675 / JCM 12634 / Mx s8) TaxID=1278073 RepID=L7UHQ4_MYXSD|nr:cytochrome P450 [Myxococcus stipitatus]AGC48511.1 cytochrome P450 family protein [Myxococcus stipitatus DSM 14675]